MENVYTSFRPFYVLSKALGVFALSFQKQPRKGVFQMRWFDLLVSCLAVLLPGILILTSIFTHLISTKNREMALLYKLWFAEMVIGTTLMALLVPYQMAKSRSIGRFLDVLNKFDEHVRYTYSQNVLSEYFILLPAG